MVNCYNIYCDEYGVKRLFWNIILLGYVVKYFNKKGFGKNQCLNWEYFGGLYGENFVIGYGIFIQVVVVWGDERKDYNWNKLGFSVGIGYFIQMVWKDIR